MPPFDASLRFWIPGLRVDELDTEVGADRSERVGDVGRAAIDVVRARQAVVLDRRQQHILVREHALVGAEAAADDESRRSVEDRDQVRLALLPVRPRHPRAVHHVADPQVARVLGQE